MTTNFSTISKKKKYSALAKYYVSISEKIECFIYKWKNIISEKNSTNVFNNISFSQFERRSQNGKRSIKSTKMTRKDKKHA